MKLPIDTSAIAFLCALAPEPVIDFETRRPKADADPLLYFGGHYRRLENP